MQSQRKKLELGGKVNEWSRPAWSEEAVFIIFCLVGNAPTIAQVIQLYVMLPVGVASSETYGGSFSWLHSHSYLLVNDPTSHQQVQYVSLSRQLAVLFRH